MKNIITGLCLFISIYFLSCSKKDIVTVDLPTSTSTDQVSLTGKWSTGLQTDIVNGRDASVAGSSTSAQMKFNSWEFTTAGLLKIGNGSTTKSIAYQSLPDNKVVLTINGISDTMSVSNAGQDEIVLSETKNLRSGNTLTQTLELYRLKN